MKIKDLVDLTRPEHALMLAIAVIIGEIITFQGLPPLDLILLSILPPIFIQFGSFSLNDFLDVESDKLNKRLDRPLVRGEIKPETALYVAIISFISGNLFAYFINPTCLLISIVFSILAILYNYKLKDIALLGNAYIASTMAIPFIFGNFVVSKELTTLTIILGAIAFIAGLAREIIKSIQDMEGDIIARKSKTLPVIVGPRNSAYLAILLYIGLIKMSLVPYLFNYLSYSILSILLLVLADLLILVICIKVLSQTKEAFRFARSYSLIALFLGLLSYLVAVFKI
ncbi:UbiA family prenyltransferase [Candidatus Micrarchaeota archaeon]|nr:UbiA family prenyltransferase [Candidatus Micrarchaeota archaeon]